jgi:PAS domain S-box-containing protein
MSSDEREEELLRSVAFENAKSILRARQRAERELLATKEALEKKNLELAGSLAMIRATLESTFDGILVTDGAGEITGFNEKYLEMWELPRELMEGGEHRKLLAVCAQQFADPQRYQSRVEEIYANAPPESTDLLELTDGRVFERFSTIQWIEGRNIGRVWSFRDVSPQKRAEAELREQREWFRVTLASIGDAVITTDTQERVTFLNPVAEKMTGWTSSAALGAPLEHIFKIVNEDTRERVATPVGQVLRDGSIVALANHTSLISKDGTEVPIEDSAAPIRDAHGKIIGAVMVFHDVTARRRAEDALRMADRRKDEFLATLAHELRNPLAPIRQAALISKAAAASGAQKRWSHDVIERQVLHMSLLLDDLLDISRVTRGTLVLRMQPTDLASMIDAAVETARPTIDAKRHALTVEIPPEPVRFSADPLRMAQILSNLLTNAAKYTDAEGQIRLTANAKANQIVIRVADTGIGISADALPGIFEMFAQVHSSTDRSEGGLGIGLALTKGLVELHGGKIEARSAGLGRGSEFTIVLPRRAATEGRERESGAADTSRRSPSRRVLIADDNRDAAETLAALLRMEGHEVTLIHDGLEAVCAYESLRPDVALLDIGMPGLNGYEVARKIREGSNGSAARLIAITGWGQESDKARALAAGFDYHLTKPIDLRRLSELLQPGSVTGTGDLSGDC